MDDHRTRIDGTNPTHLAVVDILTAALCCEDWRASDLDAMLGEDLGFDTEDAAEIAEDIELQFHRTPDATAPLFTPAAHYLRVRDVIGMADPTDPHAGKD